jgi:L-threonylcarbamoyladenylate synthase
MYFNWKDDTSTEELKIVCNLIKNGELVIFPTETVYGIGANAYDATAVNKIFIAKGRPQDNPLIVHVATKQQIDDITLSRTPVEQKLIDNFMPGPFTLILPKSDKIPDVVSSGLPTIGVRMPNNFIASAIIARSGVPIAAPSANISGKPSGTSVEDIRKELEGKVSCIVDGGKTDIGIESTVVKVVNEVPIILRPGKVSPEDIKKVIGKVEIDKNVFSKMATGSSPESPGMKYKHYAPSTKCKLYYGTNELDVLFEINKQIRISNFNAIVIGFKEHKSKVKNIPEENFISVASKDNIEEYGKNIFSALRKADKMKADIILIEGVEKQGLGLAIMNRLLRTCEFDYREFD